MKFIDHLQQGIKVRYLVREDEVDKRPLPLYLTMYSSEQHWIGESG